MCGRVVEADAPIEFSEHVLARQLILEFEARYNIAPTMPLYLVAEIEGERVLTAMRWGLIPQWAKDPSIGQKLINARAETVAEKPAFRAAFRRQRCIVPVDAFYEWQRAGSAKIPHAIRRRDRKPLALAGLWSSWTDRATGATVDTCAIITTTANELMATIHDRMPAVLPEDTWEHWLDPSLDDVDALQAMLGPCPSDSLEAYRVSPRVNNTRNDGPDLLEPVE